MNHSNHVKFENPPIIMKEMKESSPQIKILGLLSKSEKKKFKTSIHLDQHKKGVIDIVSESIKSTFVDTFNKKPTKI